MAKLFCISDVHGFYNEMREALDNAGFDPNNEEHWLISLGDIWDRGKQPFEVMQYLKRLPRKVLIRGNHMDLFEDCCERGEYWGHDISNGTYKTICILGGMNLGYSFAECCEHAEAMTRMFRKSMVNYFETKNYIFVHAWVPLNCNDNLPPYYTRNRKYSKMENWREANDQQWADARWNNPYEFAEQGLLPDKTLLFGHWNTSWAHNKYEGSPEFGYGADFSPYYGDNYIGIDSCVAHSGKINCVVLEDEFMEGDAS